MSDKIKFRRIKGRVVPIKSKGKYARDDMKGVSTKKLIEARDNYGKLQHSTKRGESVSEFSETALRGEINKRLEAKAEKMFSHRNMMKGLEQHYKRQAHKKKKPRSQHSVGGYNFYYGKKAHSEFKKNKEGSWITARGAKIYFIKDKGKMKISEEIPF